MRPNKTMRQAAVRSSPGSAWKAPTRAALAAVLAFSVVQPVAPAHAESRISVVRDAETEALLADYLRPIVKVAGISMPKLALVNSPAFNAFVAPDRRMFVNTGTIISSNTPNELIGVLAHETGHIAHNDIARMQQVIADTKAAMLLATLAGVGVGLGGAALGAGDASSAGAGIISGSTSIAERSLLRYKREVEASADRAGMEYLNKTQQSPAGMLRVLERLADEGLLNAAHANPYLQSHPLPRERIATLQQLINASPYANKKDSASLQARHDLVRAKLVGFTMPALQVNRVFPISDRSLPAQYARAIATYRSGRALDALGQIDGLIKAAPKYPYFWELKGQALLETGRPREALDPLRKAVALAPNANLIKVLLGQALVAAGGRSNADQAVKLLAAAVATYPDLPGGYHALARAYAMQDNVPMAQLATAQGLFVDGNVKEAQIQAIRAQAKLKKGSPAWLRADDIVSYKPKK